MRLRYAMKTNRVATRCTLTHTLTPDPHTDPLAHFLRQHLRVVPEAISSVTTKRRAL
jgi:hypothetical protein